VRGKSRREKKQASQRPTKQTSSFINSGASSDWSPNEASSKFCWAALNVARAASALWVAWRSRPLRLGGLCGKRGEIGGFSHRHRHGTARPSFPPPSLAWASLVADTAAARATCDNEELARRKNRKGEQTVCTSGRGFSPLAPPVAGARRSSKSMTPSKSQWMLPRLLQR